MRIPYYHIDAFTSELFRGNPAGVCALETWLPDATMQAIARENGLAETAFFIPSPEGYGIRWFTPEIEMDLCGHATLASAFVIKTFLEPGLDALCFFSRSGPLPIRFLGDRIEMSLPSRPPEPSELPDLIAGALSLQPSEVLKSRDYVLVYRDESEVAELRVNQALLDRINLDPGGVCVTARGDSCDFVSRYFTPQSSILEDPVTGSAHCSLVPLWSDRLGKKSLEARQISRRGGELHCQREEGSILVSGRARAYLQGSIEIPGS